MGQGYSVEPEQLRTHASHLLEIEGRFAAVLTASQHIEQDEEAYGFFCGWISTILEGRHQTQDELIGMVAANLTSAAEALRASADDYEDTDGQNGSAFDELQSRLWE
ncbi:type VII secretion target [Glycomyces sp. NPDC046736]|uniref:type VII secretion target n=1 Tax=Glycomyces sp. NPDC046736 TaxID=3155615 RepID=UPI0033C9F932